MTHTTPEHTISSADLAHEVLQAVAAERHAALSGSVEDHSRALENMFDVAERAAPTLARAALNVAALADRLDAEADRMGSRGGAFTARAFATEIRTALNGETND